MASKQIGLNISYPYSWKFSTAGKVIVISFLIWWRSISNMPFIIPRKISCKDRGDATSFRFKLNTKQRFFSWSIIAVLFIYILHENEFWIMYWMSKYFYIIHLIEIKNLPIYYSNLTLKSCMYLPLDNSGICSSSLSSSTSISKSSSNCSCWLSTFSFLSSIDSYEVLYTWMLLLKFVRFEVQ